MEKKYRCPRPDSNGHALMGTGPQPAVYANSTTGASNSHYMQLMRLVNLLSSDQKPLCNGWNVSVRALPQDVVLALPCHAPHIYVLATNRAQFTTRLVFVNR